MFSGLPLPFTRSLMNRNTFALSLLGLSMVASLTVKAAQPSPQPPPNILFILTDDQRFDELGFLNPVLETPNMDRLAEQGVYFKNAFVTTSLCSPSRASILTGLYAHTHGIVDNSKRDLPHRTFAQYLQTSGYNTAFVGKWHIGGDSDRQQPGFDHWVSFAGQGSYWPTRTAEDGGGQSWLNVDGERVPQTGYITDELTDYSVEWLDKQKASGRPFLLYLSHKAVHADFLPATRHSTLYENAQINLPANGRDPGSGPVPMWVQNQRNSYHGMDFPYYSDLDIPEYLRRYHQTLAAVDDSIGRLIAWLESQNQIDNTIVVLMGDNGFLFGEHGLIDKRNAYEESIRVPLLAMHRGVFPAGLVIDEMVANIDIAPTFLDAAGLVPPDDVPMHGSSWYGLAKGATEPDWRQQLLYEYFWEWTLPHTPTTYALRTDRYKLIQYHGVWDTDELYDLSHDDAEGNNLIATQAHGPRVRAMRQALYEELLATGGQPAVPFTRKQGPGAVYRNGEGAPAAGFPSSWQRTPDNAEVSDYKD